MSRFVEQNFRRNYLFGLANGLVFGFVDAIAAPALVLAVFVAQLGGSNFLIGLLPAIYNGGWFMPQFLVAHRLQPLPLKKPVYVAAAVVRIACWGILVVAVFVVGAANPTAMLIIFFVLFVIYSFAAGFGGNAFMTIVAKVIPVARRGSFFGWREFLGTLAGLLAGYIVLVVLSPTAALPFPQNFGLLFILTFASVTLGLTLFAQVREPREEAPGPARSFREHLGAARGVVRENHRYRRYLLTRVTLAAGDLATPFYAIYAIRELGAPDSIVGLYIGMTTLAALVSTPILSWLSDRHHLDWVLVLAATITPLLPLLALVFGFVSDGSTLAILFSVVFLVSGLGRTAANIAFPTFLLNLAPPTERTLYIGLTNTLLGIATFIPVVGGLLLDLFGFTPLFVITLLVSAAGTWMAWGLVSQRQLIPKAREPV